VFVDDTGHEVLLPDQKVYGLSGCAVLAPALDPVVRVPWREVRMRVTGSPDTPLHASEFDRFDVSKEVRAGNIRCRLLSDAALRAFGRHYLDRYRGIFLLGLRL
jgi:hypothetical protein